MEHKSIAAVVLAAGKGRRMQSDQAKVLHTIHGKPLLFYTLTTLKQLGLGQTIVVVHYHHQAVTDYVTTNFSANTVLQGDTYGTGAALASALPVLASTIRHCLCLYGDNAMFVHEETYERLLAAHVTGNNVLTFATREIENPTKQGRVVRGASGNVEGIVEMKDATPKQLLIKEVNSGLYVFDRSWLETAIVALTPSPVTQEYYVTDLIGLALAQGKRVVAINFGQTTEWRGVTTQEDIKNIEATLPSL